MASHRPLLLLALLAAALAPGAAAAADVEVGHVVAIEGHATATRPGEPARVLACGDPVHADERLATEPGAHLVVSGDGRTLHLAGDSLLLVRRGDEGPLTVLVRGHARLIDSSARPEARVANGTGVLRSAAADVEVWRLASGELRICDWSRSGADACRRVDANGFARPVLEEGPRLDLRVGAECPWRGREWTVADFLSTPPVASGPDTGGPVFEPEFDPELPGCGGDECSPTDLPELPPAEIIYTVDPPISFIP